MNGQGAAIRIDVYSDVICPWCYVGKRRLERALQQVGETVKTRVVWKPFQLNPTMPKNGLDRRQYLETKFGGPEAARAIYDRVAAAGVEEEIPFVFERIARTPNTFAAHRLIWLAGHLGKQEEMVEVLFHHYFVEGGDIGSIETLSLVAAQAGLDQTETETFLTGDEGVGEVKAEEAVGHRLGIRGVPYFVVNGVYVLSGAQPPEQFVAALRESAAGSAVGKVGG
ncbi:MAG: putative thiol oxidoreductase, DsbA family, FrnE subfamily [Candidatus Nitrospira kreftii]|uniref:Putative thiol oxidoreductase, DsbA family, FrnE subfamily n=1 Tax=Candidatus Nitrospira kreftii TaxID=2652173 RepID=A0A7S8FGT9_9BACT|nr:MAG: putative thiol oxidoreductase, DsbA family, FrnE subfamily [Candidatus Nitrospira kreftii]